jgi:hypothetical protein
MPVNTQMGMGHDRFDEGLNAWASEARISESNHRQVYRRWAQFLAADNWAGVPNGHANGSNGGTSHA